MPQDPKPVPEQDKDYQNERRAEEQAKCAEAVKPPSGGKK